MKKYETKAPIILASGKLGLTDEQYKTRTFALQPIGKSVYEIHKPVQFKAGEIIFYDGDLTKAQVIDLEELAEKAKDAGRLPSTEVIELINACSTIAEVDEMAKDDTRKKVQKAAEERKAFLEAELAKESEGLTFDAVIEKIGTFETIAELEAFMAEIDPEGLTEDEKSYISQAVEEQTGKINSAQAEA